MLSAPLARAEEDHGRGKHEGDRDEHRPAIMLVVEDQHKHHDDDVVVRLDADRANDLVQAINNEVTILSTVQFNVEGDEDDEDEDADEAENEVEAVEVPNVRTISLATLEAGLTTDQANAVTAAVNNNMAALQSFLNGGTANATTIDAALSAAGVTIANVKAILVRGDTLIVVTS